MTILSRRRLLGAAAGAALGSRLRARAEAQGQARGAGGQLHAVVVGINAYQAVPELHGAVNDARAIAAALQPYAASVEVLTDAAVTRAALIEAWGTALRRAAPGDTVLLTYSGHGGRERRRGGATAIGTRDGTLILPRFETRGRAADERLFDDEVNLLFVEPGRRNVRIVLVVDCCHSGTMTRSAAPGAAGVRFRTIGDYDVGELAVALPPPRPATPDALRHVVYLAAGQENELVPEVPIDGVQHGAMSWSFARALAGGADDSSDGRITWGALSRTVLRSVRGVADAMQHPELRPADRTADVLFVRRAAAPPAPPPPGPPVVRLRVLALAPAARDELLSGLTGVVPAPSADDADAIFDPVAKQLLSALGDILATDIDASRLQRAIDKLLAVQAVRRLAVRGGLDTRLLLRGENPADPPSRDSDRTHVQGTRLAFAASGLRFPNLLLVNLGGDGTVQLLYPQRNDPPAVDPRRPYVLDAFTVTPPFGADHLIAVAAARPLGDLVAAIRRLDGQRAAREVAALLEALPAAETQVGLQGLYTAPR